MAWVQILFRSVAEALCAQGVRGLAGLVPFGEVVYDVAGGAYERFRIYRAQEAERDALEAVVRATAEEVKEEAWAAARDVFATQPPAMQAQVASYLMQIPPLMRQTFKRPSDVSGRSMPLIWSLEKPEDLLSFLPARLPRFKPGDCPPGVGDWELVELLGVGGFGEVWKAKHRYFDGIAPVALKFCLDATARDRLLRYEASVLNQVMRQGRHPGVVALLDAYLSSDPPCLKYEFIEGGDLSGVVREWREQSLTDRWQSATRIVADLARIIASAHRLQPPIVHRDLKPANVLVQRPEERQEPGGNGRVSSEFILRVTDFGIGSVAALPAIAEARQGTTTRGRILATSLRGAHTPLYASPQQMRGEAPDVRDDVHALGVVWYQLLTADLGTGAPTGLWSDELEEAGMSRDLVRLLGACVSSKVEKRPADAGVLAEQLTKLLAPPPAPKPAPLPPAPAVTPKPPAPPVAPPPPAEKPAPIRGTAFPDHAPPSDSTPELLRVVEANPSSWLLDLINKGIGDRGVQVLAKSPTLANRTVLDLSGNNLSDVGAKALASSPHIANLTRLILWDNHIGDEGVKALANSPHLANLTALDLGRNRVGDAGAEALAAAPLLANLSALILVSNQIGDTGAAAIAASPHLANLAELKPLNNRITSTGVALLRDRFGKRVRIY